MADHNYNLSMYLHTEDGGGWVGIDFTADNDDLAELYAGRLNPGYSYVLEQTDTATPTVISRTAEEELNSNG